MTVLKRAIIAAVILMVTSCATQKSISYLQDIQPDVGILTQQEGDLTLQPGDRLRITVFSMDKELTELFNLTENYVGNGSQRHYYTVRKDGTVEIPTLGPVGVAGLTREGVADKIKYELLSSKLLLDPTVVVEYDDLAFSVIGEVGSPGRKVIPTDRITLLEALALSGDLTIVGQRENILVLRTENGVQTPYVVDLTKKESLYGSPVYYIRQNDVIYVEPNPKKAAQAYANAGTVRTIGFWLSMPATLASIAALLLQVLK
ncbi:MAG: polysaccharide biosynthesis/export family protein [Bacteroidales bacterium]|nr:polysaccharide biosynthesis/export family protein [Bacteroidales bacterium]